MLYSPASGEAFVNGQSTPALFRPDQVAGQSVWLNDPNAPGGKKLNPEAFTIPSLFGQGSEGRNNIRGFPLVEVDLAVRRQLSRRTSARSCLT